MTATTVALAIVACVTPTTPGEGEPSRPRASADVSPGDPNSASNDTPAIIGAWLDGERVELRYTRSYYCEEPPESLADSECEIGAPPEVFPRGGRVPTIYALAPVGFVPADPTTVHCMGCPNHPPMIDVMRLGIPGVTLARRPPHSHIITSRQAGWHNTVNIRVLSPLIWNEIAASPSLATVRRLQSEYPALISRDYPTNIFFFFQVAPNASAP